MTEEPNAIRDFWKANHAAKEYTGMALPNVHVSCPLVKCSDGFSMSVQASGFHYCLPRTYLDDGEYHAWEIGFPSAAEPLIMDWIEGDETTDPTDTVYGYVPTKIINEVIAKHGGLAA